MLSSSLVKFLFLTLPQRKPVAVSVSDDDEVVDPEPPRKRTRSQTKAATTAAKGKGKAPAKASSSSTRGRRSKKAATPPPVEEPEREEEKEEEERSSPESEDRDTVPPAFRPLARVRLNWEHYPRDESGERIPYVETEHEAREREHLEFLSKGPTPLYGLNGDMVAMGGSPSDDGDDEADSTVREPPKKKTKAKAKSAVQNDASKFENKKRKRSLGENLRHLLQNLSPTRLVHFSWGH